MLNFIGKQNLVFAILKDVCVCTYGMYINIVYFDLYFFTIHTQRKLICQKHDYIGIESQSFLRG